MEITSIFDVIGPVMVGPSSSHTAGAVKIGLVANQILGEAPKIVKITLFGSFAKTGKGHGTDKAILAGLLGLKPEDKRISQIKTLAKQKNIDYSIEFADDTDESLHPNTVKIELNSDNDKLEIWASSLGAGKVEVWKINDFRCSIDGTAPAVLIWHRDMPGIIGKVATILGENKINIGRFHSSRIIPGGSALITAIVDQLPNEEILKHISRIDGITEIKLIKPADTPKPENKFIIPRELLEKKHSADELVDNILTLESKTTCSSKEDIKSRLKQLLEIMHESLAEGRNDHSLSSSNLVGTEHTIWAKFIGNDRNILNTVLNDVIRDALALASYNAKMGRIVSLPTAGACGIVPSTLINIAKHNNITEDTLIDGLLIAGFIGAIIGTYGSLSGAECGCQAECGSAAAMAAGGVCAMFGCDSEVIYNAAALALKNHLGLTCDPVCGLVEVPCVKRNAFSAISAVVSAQLAMSGIKSIIPFREVVDVMYKTGKMISPALRESAEAGLAKTPTACKLAKEIS